MPYEKRGEARAAGFRWDSDARKWYAPTPEIAERIKKASEGKTPASGSPNNGRSGAEGDRAYFNVPFAQKDQAKALGMRFDGERKAWFAPSPEVAQAAAKTFPAQS